MIRIIAEEPKSPGILKLGDPEFRSVFSSYVRILPQETSGTWIRDGR